MFKLTCPEVWIGAHHAHDQWTGEPPCQRRAMREWPSDLQRHGSNLHVLHPTTWNIHRETLGTLSGNMTHLNREELKPAELENSTSTPCSNALNSIKVSKIMFSSLKYTCMFYTWAVWILIFKRFVLSLIMFVCFCLAPKRTTALTKVTAKRRQLHTLKMENHSSFL